MVLQKRRSAGDVIRVNTTLVSVPVTVMDRNGKYIPNLRKEDFRVGVDGVEQQVKYFAAEEAPVSLGVVFDASRSMEGKLDQSRAAVGRGASGRPAPRRARSRAW